MDPAAFPSDLDTYLDDSLFSTTPPDSASAQSSPQFPAPSHQYSMHPQSIDSMFGMQLDSDQPAFFYPESSASPPVKPEQSPRKMYYSGIHQEMFAAQQQQQQKKAVAAPTDERINQVMAQMKAAYQPANGRQNQVLPHIARMKKEEEEMDEDERLLASEEGKKLSSKERRQLRNKVSARAFRSRRKEYINQLEAEVNKKNTESQRLAEENERLRAENQRLEDLSRMLLRSPAFSTFLDQMSTQTPPPQQQQQQQQPTTTTTAPPPSQPTFNPTKDTTTANNNNWSASNFGWSPVQQVFRMEMPPLPDFDGEDYTISDGFFSMARDEKANFNLEEAKQQDAYAPPENLADVKQVDDLFPGVGVTDFLTRLDKVAAGQARAEDMFPGQNNTTAARQSTASQHCVKSRIPDIPNRYRHVVQ